MTLREKILTAIALIGFIPVIYTAWQGVWNGLTMLGVIIISVAVFKIVSPYWRGN